MSKASAFLHGLIAKSIFSTNDKGNLLKGFPGGSAVKNFLTRQEMQETRLDPWVRSFPWRRAWRPTPVFLPGESQGQRSLAGDRPWGRQELNTTEATKHAHTRSFKNVSQ